MDISPITIILSGVAVNALCGGGIGYLSIMYSDRLPSAVQWLNGSLAAKGNNALFMVFPYAIVGWILSIFAIRKANIIRMGDQVASNLGENVNRIRILIVVIGCVFSGYFRSSYRDDWFCWSRSTAYGSIVSRLEL